MFIIHNRNLKKIIYTQNILIRNINILLEKIKCKILVKINKSCNIFDNIEQYLKDKKKIHLIKIYKYIYKKLYEISNKLDNNISKFKYIYIYITRK